MGPVNTKQPQIDVDNFHIVIIDYDLWRYENWEYGKIRLETGWRWQPGDGTCPIRDATTWTPSTLDQKSVQGFLVMMMVRKWSNLEFSRFSDVRNLARYKAHIYNCMLFGCLNIARSSYVSVAISHPLHNEASSLTLQRWLGGVMGQPFNRSF